MFKNFQVRTVFFVLVCVAILMLKRHYTGPLAEAVHAYVGNISASFAVYFIVNLSAHKWNRGKLVAAGVALLVVELFEATNGYGVMSNVYDQMDFIANAVGVGLALAVESKVERFSTSRQRRQS
jgi:hypothetical protein